MIYSALKYRRQLVYPFYGNNYRPLLTSAVNAPNDDMKNILALEQCRGPKSASQTYDQTNIVWLSIIVAIEPTMKPLSDSSHGAYKARSQFSDLLISSPPPPSPHTFLYPLATTVLFQLYI